MSDRYGGSASTDRLLVDNRNASINGLKVLQEVTSGTVSAAHVENSNTTAGSAALVAKGGADLIRAHTLDGTQKLLVDQAGNVSVAGNLALTGALTGAGSLAGASFAPAGAIAQTIPPYLITTSAIAAASGQMYIFGVQLSAGQTITSISFLIGTTAGLTLSHGWYGLLNSAYLQVAHTADQTSAGLTASTISTKALTAPYAVTASGIYWLSFTVVASTQPTLAGFGTSQGASGLAGVPSGGTSTASLTAPGTDNTTTYLSPQAVNNAAYAYVS